MSTVHESEKGNRANPSQPADGNALTGYAAAREEHRTAADDRSSTSGQDAQDQVSDPFHPDRPCSFSASDADDFFGDERLNVIGDQPGTNLFRRIAPGDLRSGFPGERSHRAGDFQSIKFLFDVHGRLRCEQGTRDTASGTHQNTYKNSFAFNSARHSAASPCSRTSFTAAAISSADGSR